jgi:origin recognition complex subunit 4
LANEQLKRQREARNFKYTGDADAPRLTRSGKVVGDAQHDEYDVFDKDATPDEVNEDLFKEPEELVDGITIPEAVVRDEEEMFVDDQPEKPLSKSVDPLPESARPYITEILTTLTSTKIADKPKPFHDELQNDTLLSLTKLLQGTIDRSEGNSALITGPRGSGKTRVSSSESHLCPLRAEMIDNGKSPQSSRYRCGEDPDRRQTFWSRPNQRSPGYQGDGTSDCRS